jgi:hypothetical protein
MPSPSAVVASSPTTRATHNYCPCVAGVPVCRALFLLLCPLLWRLQHRPKACQDPDLWCQHFVLLLQLSCPSNPLHVAQVSCKACLFYRSWRTVTARGKRKLEVVDLVNEEWPPSWTPRGYFASAHACLHTLDSYLMLFRFYRLRRLHWSGAMHPCSVPSVFVFFNLSCNALLSKVVLPTLHSEVAFKVALAFRIGVANFRKPWRRQSCQQA